MIAFHRDIRGQLLDERTAAVELLNVIRPTVAVSYLVTFAGLALHHHPDWKEKLRADHDTHVQNFVQEVRRFFPLAPFMGARARKAFRWKGFKIPRGRLVILDLYGTNHDRRIWDTPDAFRPERFEHWNHGPFNFIPQGGGDHFAGHRCAGEWMTIRLLRIAVECLTRAIAYEVPAQDLGIPTNRMPTLPARGFVIDRIRRLNSMTPCVRHPLPSRGLEAA